MTWPLVILRVNRSSYEDIKRRIIAAGQPDRIFDDGRISVDEVAIEIDPADTGSDDDLLHGDRHD